MLVVGFAFDYFDKFRFTSKWKNSIARAVLTYSGRIISQVFRTNRKIIDKFRSTNLGGQIPDTLPGPDVYVDSQ